MLIRPELRRSRPRGRARWRAPRRAAATGAGRRRRERNGAPRALTLALFNCLMREGIRPTTGGRSRDLETEGMTRSQEPSRTGGPDRPEAVILLYHRVAEPEADVWSLAISPTLFV